MKHSFTASTDAATTSNDTPHQLEDAAMKLSMQYFADELLPYFHIDGEVDHIGPTEITHKTYDRVQHLSRAAYYYERTPR